MSTHLPESSDPRSLIRYAFLCLAVTIVLLWTMYLVRSQLLVIYVSALFATGLAPLVRMIERQRVVRLRRRRLPRAAAILAIYATLIGVIAGMAWAVFPPLARQARQLWINLPTLIGTLEQRLAEWGLLSPGASYKELLQQAPAGSGDAVTAILATLWGFVGGLFGFVSILLLTFYLLVEAQGAFNVFVRLFPPARRETVSAVAEKVAVKISAWLGGQMLLGFIIGVTTAIALAIMGVPYYFVLAMIAGIGEMIPMVGPLLSAIPAIAVAFTVSPGLALAVTIFFLIQQALENNVLVPKVMGQQVGLSAVAVIIALSIGSSLLGIVGALLAVPTAAIVQVLFEELYLAEKDAA